MRAALALAVLLALPASAHAGAVNLRLRADAGPDTRVSRATLTCDAEGPRATGFLRKRDAARICRRAYALETFLGSAPPGDRACTEVYGGPSRVTVKGTVRGTAVSRRFERTDGCQIADWDRARLLLPPAVSPF